MDESSEVDDDRVDTGEELDSGAIRGPRHLRDIRLPSREEVEKHNVTHFPFRNWCPHCTKGRGKEAPHYSVKGGAGELPEISLDFCFPSKEGDNGGLTMLAARERYSKMTMATVVPSKSTGTFIARRIWAFLREIGCKNGDLILKSDQEPAIMSIVGEVSRIRAAQGGVGRTIEEVSPVGSSSSNGIVERAIQSIEEQVRVLASALENRWEREIPVKHAIWPWLTEYSGLLLNRCNVGSDGKTAYERNKGKAAHFSDHEFGELVLWKRRAMKGPLGKLSSTWSKGIYLGIKGISDEKIIGTPEGIFRTRTTQRVPIEERWNSEASAMVGGVPWLLQGDDEKADGEALNQEPMKPLSEELMKETEAKESVPRRMNIRKQDFGYAWVYAWMSWVPDCSKRVRC